jgi:hypothetical protein
MAHSYQGRVVVDVAADGADKLCHHHLANPNLLNRTFVAIFFNFIK